MSDIVYLLAASGIVAWGIVIWRSAQLVRQSFKRVRWALWGYRKRHKRAT